MGDTALTDFVSAQGDHIQAADLYDLLVLRAEVFVVEQECPYLDPDGRDLLPSTTHIWLHEDGRITAALRILDRGAPIPYIGRVVTARASRGQGRAARLLRHALGVLSRPVDIEAQAHLEAWYERFGFRTTGSEFDLDGIAHVPMRWDPGMQRNISP